MSGTTAMIRAEDVGGRSYDLVPHGGGGSSSGEQANATPPMGPPLSETLLPKEGLDRVLRQGWEAVPTILSEAPPPLVGATLSCLEVPLHARGIKASEEDAVAELAAQGPQLGLFLFGGDDDQNHQTDTLMIFYLQEHKWRHPSDKGRRPSKRSRHTASVIPAGVCGVNQRLLIFGGVGATNAVSMLDPESLEWTQPPSRSKPGEKERAKRRAAKASSQGSVIADALQPISESLLPCARFGHTTAVIGRRLLLFGGADFKGPLGDLYQCDLDGETLEWSRPEAAGVAPPPSSRHCCAIVRDHMLLISGETSWGGHMWALKLSTPMTWIRSTLPDFPLLGVSRHALVPYITPRPHRREELLLFGGHLEAYGREESEVLDAFFTLDFRSWKEEEAEKPRETWADVEAKLIEAGKVDVEVERARKDWEEEMRRKQKMIRRANRRRERRERRKKRLEGTPMGAAEEDEEKKRRGGKGGAAAASSAEDDEEEELSDEEAIAAREAEKEFELPPEMMPTITFGEFVPLRAGRNLPPPRFGHAMCLAGSTAYVFGGRNKSISAPVLHDFHKFDAAPLVWKEIAYDGDGPGTRVSHTMVQLEHYLYVLGGGSGNRAFNDLHRLDLFTMHWELIHTQGAVPGAKPDALIGHSVEWVDPFVVFAGGDGRRPSNDLHTLELRTATWRAIATQGALRAARRSFVDAPRLVHVHHRRLLQGQVLSRRARAQRGKPAVEPADCERQGAVRPRLTLGHALRGGHPPLWRLGGRHVLQRLLCLLAGGSQRQCGGGGGRLARAAAAGDGGGWHPQGRRAAGRQGGGG